MNLAQCIYIYTSEKEVVAIFNDDGDNLFFLNIFDENHFNIGDFQEIEYLNNFKNLEMGLQGKIIERLEKYYGV